MIIAPPPAPPRLVFLLELHLVVVLAGHAVRLALDGQLAAGRARLPVRALPAHALALGRFAAGVRGAPDGGVHDGHLVSFGGCMCGFAG